MERQVLNELKCFEKKAMRIINRDLPKLTDGPRNLTEVQIMTYLYNHQDQEVYLKDIVAALKLQKSSITERLDIMEGNGLIIRVEDENDRRRKRVMFAPEVEERNQIFNDNLNSLNKKIIEGISQEKISIFLEVLDLMSENLER